MKPDDEFVRRRKSRAVITAFVLGSLVVLFYFITIAKISR